MSALADAGGTQPPQEPLGTLLVKRGLLTPDQLEAALAEQKVSGRPLGAIVVARGYAPAGTVAQALATQHGGLLKTEYGFATGFAGDLPSNGIVEPPVSVPKVGIRTVADEGPALAVVEPPVEIDAPREPEIGVPSIEVDRDAVRSELALASQETERLSAANERLADARADLERRLAHEAQKISGLESAVTARDERIAELTDGAVAWDNAYKELGQHLAQATERVTELEGELEARRSELDGLRASGSAVTDDSGPATLELEQRLAELGEQLAEATQHVARLEEEVKVREATLEELRESAATCEAARGELERGLAEEVERAATLRAELEAALAGRADAESSADERAMLEQRLAEIGERAAALEAEVAAGEELRTAAAASESAQAELEERLAKAAEQLEAAAGVRDELEQRLRQATEGSSDLEARAAAADELRSEAFASERARVDLEQRLTALEAELAERAAELERAQAEADARAEAEAAPADPWAAADSHLVFFRTGDSYELVERPGPPPAAGTRLDEGVVARIARGALPGELPCAYLVG